MQMNRSVQFILYSNFHTIIPVAYENYFVFVIQTSTFENIALNACFNV